MICNGWVIENEYVPFSDSRQGQPNGVATLNSDASEVEQDTEPPTMFANTTNWSSTNTRTIANYVSRALVGLTV